MKKVKRRTKSGSEDVSGGSTRGFWLAPSSHQLTVVPAPVAAPTDRAEQERRKGKHGNGRKEMEKG
jgi:hypothetical protein